MKKTILLLAFVFFLSGVLSAQDQNKNQNQEQNQNQNQNQDQIQNQNQSWIRINCVGYLPNDSKVAVFISTASSDDRSFKLYDATTDQLMFEGIGNVADAERWGMKVALRLNFSPVKREGGYYIVCNGTKSPNFKISASSYDGLADYLLNYMRQQRCGDNPYNDTLCHQKDGYIVDHPTRNGEHIDVTGGWHDATDYLQYQTTSATTIYHMLFAYDQAKDKTIFKDEYDARGRRGANGIPDILDEAKWGLDWLLKMNPQDKVMFNQIADDRDHAGFRLPYRDKVDYGWGPGNGRPVYFVTGKPQGLGKYINRTTGVASTAGKFSSTFALGSEVFKKINPSFSAKLKGKVEQAYNFAEEFPGNTQTACLKSPYFYEEDTYVDDIELAAATIYNFSGDDKWKKKADYWGELEPVTPWMELGRGRHYQYYPFINLGHYYLAKSDDKSISEKYKNFMKDGLEAIYQRGKSDPFLNGIPFIWCSNNLTSAAITQARLYNNVSGDSSYVEMETSLRDWLFGCNPWGTTMIVGYPAGSDYPSMPHSSYTVVNGDLTYGGLIDGPVYRTVFNERAGGSLRNPDSFAIFNNGIAVYHDDIGDYASNEPTMDGTAGLTYYFGELENMGRKQRSAEFIDVVKDQQGAVVRVNPKSKNIYLAFTADSMFSGAEKVLKILKRARVKGSWFLTGNCLRMPEHEDIIKKIVKEGHYVGAHSDKHILYAEWGKRDSLIVSQEDIVNDIIGNAKELEKFGISKENSLWFIPPYEYYNSESVNVIENIGYRVINYTPGSATPADYTTPDMKNYQSSQNLIDKLYDFERGEGLNGAVILIHPGIHPDRTDRLYNRLDEIISYFQKRGYSFKRL